MSKESQNVIGEMDQNDSQGVKRKSHCAKKEHRELKKHGEDAHKRHVGVEAEGLAEKMNGDKKSRVNQWSMIKNGGLGKIKFNAKVC